MADFTLGPAAFPVGTTVGAYPYTAFVADAGPFMAPVVETVVDANLEAEFSGLAFETRYWAAAPVAGPIWRKVAFTTDRDTSSDAATQGYVASIVSALTKASVGLSNVDNTSDVSKPVSTAQAAALALRALDSEARKFFPVPTGADDAAELISRFAAGETDVALRRLTYLWAQAVAFPEAAMLTGAGKRKTIVEKAYNGDFGTLATGAGFAHLTFDGKGATRTGKGFVMSGTVAQQHAEHFRLIDCAGACLEFAHQAGPQSCWFDGDIWRFDDTAADAHAIVIEDNPAVIAAHPRKFIALESGGKKFIALGGCADLFISGGGYLGPILWSNNSRGVTINGQRIGGTVTPWIIRGFNHAISGCDVGMPIEIAHGNPHTIAANTYNPTPGTPAIVDNSGFSHLNQLSIPRVAYTPAFTASGSAPSLGNGTLLGSYAREGVVVEFAIDFSVGSTTTFGTNGLRFSLPYTPQAPERQAVAGFLYDASANTYYTLVGVLAQNTAYVTMRSDATPGELSGISPITLAAGDTISLSGSYSL